MSREESVLWAYRYDRLLSASVSENKEKPLECVYCISEPVNVCVCFHTRAVQCVYRSSSVTFPCFSYLTKLFSVSFLLTVSCVFLCERWHNEAINLIKQSFVLVLSSVLVVQTSTISHSTVSTISSHVAVLALLFTALTRVNVTLYSGRILFGL